MNIFGIPLSLLDIVTLNSYRATQKPRFENFFKGL